MTESKMLAHSLSSKERTKDVILTENVSFSSLILPPEILNGLSASGFEKPSPIQIKALPVGRCGFDLIVKSKSGTGKTLIFGLIALESIRLKKLDPQVLILAPTREIAVQNQEVIKNIGKYYEGLTVKCFIGGLSLSADKAKCKSCHIAVGTPGRLKQLIQDGNLKIDSVKIFVLDEADKLIEDSFQNDINEIYNSLADHKQIIMCSATYPDGMQDFLGLYMRSPVMITVELDTPLLLGLRQYVRLLKPPPNILQHIKAKNEELLRIISTVPFIQCLVFSNYQSRAESISNFLNGNSWDSIFMSGAQNQTARLNSLSQLKDFKCKILVTTDLAARGIDAPNVDLVVNYDTPVNAMTYLHRMGRAGRFGSSGNCINLTFIGEESKLLQNILGVIGGQNMSVPILDDSFNLDVNKIPKENYLFADISNSALDYSKEINEIRNSVTENNKKTAKEHISRKSKSNDNAREKDVLNTIIQEDINNDLSSVLAKLASGSFVMSANTNKQSKKTESPSNEVEKIKAENPKSKLLLQQLADEGVVRTPDITVTAKEEPQNKTFYKNKALFSMAKILSNMEVSNEDCTDLSTYFSTLKSQESVECHDGKSEHVDHLKPSAFLENVFSLAYKSQVSKEAVKWQNLIPNEEKGKLDEDFKTIVDADIQYEEAFDEEYYDEDYDFEIEKDIEVKYVDNSNDYSFMEWVPVEPESSQKKVTKATNETPNGEIQNSALAKKKKTVCYESHEAVTNAHERYYAEYNQYFQHCNNNLWQNGLTFDSVKNFDLWFFNDWGRQLDTVRDFVQNKIYLEEMSNYL